MRECGALIIEIQGNTEIKGSQVKNDRYRLISRSLGQVEKTINWFFGEPTLTAGLSRNSPKETHVHQIQRQVWEEPRSAIAGKGRRRLQNPQQRKTA